MGDQPKRQAADVDEPTLAATPGSEQAGHSVLESGTVLAGRFEIGEYLGGGGGGAVFSARDHLLGESVAIKLLHEHLRDDSDQLTRLRSEVRAARRIAHPNVCRVHDLCEAGGLVFVVMEKVDGKTLRQRMGEPLGLVEALDIARQLAAGLGAAHRAGVVHCDVKPENAILSGDRLVVTDFGVARLAGVEHRKPGSASTVATRQSAIEGTPAYMAPEQILGKEVDERTDGYALAAVIYELLYGAPPFGFRTDHGTTVALLDRILREQPPFPDERPANLAPDARAALVDALRRGLAKDPADRPESVEALIAFVLAAVRLGGGGTIALSGDAGLRPMHAYTPTPTSTPTPLLAGSNAGTNTPSPATTASGPYRGARRIATVVHVRFDDEIDDEIDNDEAIADRAEALIGAAELTLTDAGGIVVGRAPRSLVAVFGAVSSRGNEPQRAAEAARAIAAAASTGEHVSVRIGCDTGRLLVRRGRGRRDGSLSVSGASLARAERLAAAASVGQVRASKRTARHLAHRFELEPVTKTAVAVHGRRPAGARAGAAVGLVGRDSETEVLVRGLAAVSSTHEPRCALMYGPSGIGKTRLACEVRDLLAARGGFAIVRVAAQPNDAYASHALIRTVLRQMTTLSDEATPDEARHAARRALSRREPHEPTIDALSALLSGATADPRVPALAAARAALSAAARRRPLLIIVEDLQWADDASLDLIESMARGELDSPIGLLASARPEIFQRRPRLRPAFRLAVQLSPLSREHSVALAEQLLGDSMRHHAPSVAEAANGNPFFLEELAQNWLESGGASTTPTTVEETIQARLDRLSESERNVLRAAALLGSVFRMGDLAAVAGQDDVEQALTSLEDKRIASPLPPDAVSDDRYAIKHTLVRDTAYDELPAAARRELHQRAARHLRKRAGADPKLLSEIARHLEGADRPAEASSSYQRAGDVAAAASDIGDAYRCYARARQLADTEPDLDLLVRFGEVATQAGALEQASDALEEARARASAEPRLEARLAHVYRALGGLARQRSRWQESVDYCRRGLELVDQERDPVLAARLLGNLGWVLGYQLGEPEGLELARRAVELLEGTPHLADLASVYSSLGACCMAAGQWEQQLHCNRRNLELGQEIGNLELQARAHLNLGENLRSLGAVDEAIEHTREALALHVRMGAGATAALARNNIALSAIELGRVDEAEAEVTCALRVSEQCGGLYFHDEALTTLARIHARRGRFDKAEKAARDAVRRCVADGSTIYEGRSRRLLGGILSMAGDCEAAMEELDRAEALLRDTDAGEAARVLAERTRVLLRAGADAAAAGQSARAALEAVGARHDLGVVTDVDYV